MAPSRLYRDRADAGRQLARVLAEELADESAGWLEPRSTEASTRPPLILALPRGGVPVAAPIARALRADLDLLMVRKLGAPGQPELAVGAVAAVGDRVVRIANRDVIGRLGLTDPVWDRIRDQQIGELARHTSALRGQRPHVSLTGRTVLLVDDGLATGATMLAAARIAASEKPARLLVVAPVGSERAVSALGSGAEVVCPLRPEPFRAVGDAYADFGQVSDAEVRRLLGR